MIEQLEIELELMKSKYNQLMEKVSAQSTEIAVMNNRLYGLHSTLTFLLYTKTAITRNK